MTRTFLFEKTFSISFYNNIHFIDTCFKSKIKPVAAKKKLCTEVRTWNFWFETHCKTEWYAFFSWSAMIRFLTTDWYAFWLVYHKSMLKPVHKSKNIMLQITVLRVGFYMIFKSLLFGVLWHTLMGKKVDSVSRNPYFYYFVWIHISGIGE